MVAMSQHRLARCLGLAGSIMIAVTAFFGGALPAMGDDPTPVGLWRSDGGPAAIGLWFAGLAALGGAWWMLRRSVPSLRWAYVTIALWSLPLLVAPPLASRDVYAYACQGATWAAGFNPYEQGVAALPCPWLESISPIWQDTPAPYGPLFVLISGLLVSAGWSLAANVVLFRLVAVAGVVLTAACLPALARRCGVPPQQAVWVALASPLVGVHLISGAHNDALMIGLLVAGLTVIVSRPGRAGPLLAGGALLGLAVAIKATAVVVVPFAVLAGLAGSLRLADLLRAGAQVVGAAVATLVAVTVAGGLSFGWVTGLASSSDAVGWTSPPTAVGQTLGYLPRAFGIRIDLIPYTRQVGLAVLAVLLVWLWWRVWRRGRDPLHGAALALAATVALSPVFHPWYALWPLALLAVTVRDRIGWFTGVALGASFLVFANGVALARYTKIPGAPLMTLAVIAVTVHLVRAARAAPRRWPPTRCRARSRTRWHDRGAAAPAGDAAVGPLRRARRRGAARAGRLARRRAPRAAAGFDPGTIWRGPYGPWILIGWFAGTAALTVAWWSLRRSVPSLRWAYVTAGLWLVPLLLAPPLGSRDLYSYACQGAVFSGGGDPTARGWPSWAVRGWSRWRCSGATPRRRTGRFSCCWRGWPRRSVVR